MQTISISEIAYALGFEHPQSFSKLFKIKDEAITCRVQAVAELMKAPKTCIRSDYNKARFGNFSSRVV